MILILFTQQGKPYIQSLVAGKTTPNAANGGFNLAVQIVFASREDMEYYESQDEAHRALKESIKEVAESPVVVTF